MKQLLKLDIDSILTEYSNSGKFILPSPYNRSKKVFVNHMLTLFAILPLIKNPDNGLISMSRTVTALPDTVMTTEGEISKTKIIDYIYCTSKVPRSTFVNKMTDNPTLGSLTPLFMYAHLLYNDVSYSSWDRDDPKIGAAIGEFLLKALNFSKEYPMHIPLGTNSDLRKTLTSSKPYTQYNPHLSYTATEEETGLTLSYPKEWLILEFQFWIANNDIRDTKSMLLDVKSFGRVPKALDAAVAPSLGKKSVREI